MMNQKGSSSQPPINIESINFSKDVQISNPQFVLEPIVKEAEDIIWKSRVMIPCPNSTHAYLGPIPDDRDNDKALNAIFPCYEKHSPLVFTKGPYNLSFMKSKFRTESKHERNEDYLLWLNKVEAKRGRFWKDIGIFDLIQLSREGPRYHNEMLIAALHLKCGMLTPTLLDVAAIA
jgi:hypothetical protein